jgi:cytochrome c-type biogenesis protein CcmI
VSGRAAERAFLERSLADLDAELAAGDLDPDDHRRLRADYRRRLAALDAPRAKRPATAPPARGARPVPAIALIVLLAVVSGVLLAQAVGRRGAGDSVTGIDLSPEQAEDGGTSAPVTATTLPVDLQACLGSTGSEAVQCFIDYTRQHPDDARGFMYFGLFSISQGLEADNTDLLDAGERFLRQAMEIDPTLFEARVNLAVFLERTDRDDEAREALAPLEGQELDPELQQLVDFVEQNLAEG